MKITVRHWLIFGIFNLLLVAVLGLLMRIKFLIPLPAINQQYVLHAHSHFAFSGWVSHTLMVLIAAALSDIKNDRTLPRRYQVLIFTNLLTAYGMLVSFFLQGYALYSICAATATVLISYLFAGICWRDMAHRADRNAATWQWLRAALIFLVFSSVGTFYLAYLMASHNTDPRLQLASIYFFLHFQYNGWFTFACFGLAHHWLRLQRISLKHASLVFWTFALSCIPLYFLSVLWWDIPGWLYTLVVSAVMLQTTAWATWLYTVFAKRRLYKHRLSTISRWLLIGIVLAVSIKILLQGLSAFPSLSQLTYGFRPIVIGYLHLVLLVIITLFLITYGYMQKILYTNRIAVIATGILVAGIMLNELLLLLQGALGLINISVAYLPMGLAIAAASIVLGLGGLLWSQKVVAYKGQFS
ncbi:hypothetical protein [Parapedobacter indicus]|uniref:NnrS protein n=1 Tax=Parapedobacter indicus TaxID=1477437 RepID=A0A1I3N5Z6_9SPHI|nr:hypothetical protein [Parapedobacter indicus]PPL00887.1 hypothetical protein CLV26_107107 [Parapedobacter indicus]SFJ04612.1 hypothetical protein SAMN05444682_107107 [Parapedobacter indicus]